MNAVIVSGHEFIKTYKSNFYAQKYYKLYKHIFPLRINSSLLYIVGSLITDGFIDLRKREGNYNYNYIGYFSKYKEELNKFNTHFYKVFRTRGNIGDWGVREHGESFGCIIINSAICRMLIISGVPGGSKTNIEYNLPWWIINSNKNYQSEFLRRIFSCEGSINKDINSNNWEIRYSMYKLEELSYNTISFLNCIRKILLKFGIITSRPYLTQSYIRRRDNRRVSGYVIKIKRDKSIINFYKHIGFDISYKQKRLNKAIKEIFS